MIVPQISSEVLTPEEKKYFSLELDAVTDITTGQIIQQYERRIPLEGRFNGVREVVQVRIFHAPDNERSYSSVYDWRKRLESKTKLNDFYGTEQKTEVISANDRDIIYEYEHFNPKEKYPTFHSIGRAVLYGGRIYYVSHDLYEFEQTPKKSKNGFNVSQILPISTSLQA